MTGHWSLLSMAPLLATAVLALVGACGSGPSASPGPDRECRPPEPASSTSAVPNALRIDALGTVTRVVSERGILTVRSVTQGTLEELDAAFMQALKEAGYTIVGSENEIIEADIYFADRRGVIGGVKFIQAGCGDRAVVRLFLDAGRGSR